MKTRTVEELKARKGELESIIHDATSEIALANGALAAAPGEAERLKAHKRIDAATAERDRAERERQPVASALAAAEASEASEAVDKQWETAEKLGNVWRNEIDTLQSLLEQLAAQHTRVFESGLAFRAALPIKPDGNEDLGMVWGGQRLTREATLQLAMASEGRWNAAGIGKTEIWNISQGPDLKAKVRENVLRVMARRPRRTRAA